MALPGQRSKGSNGVMEYWATSKLDCLKSAFDETSI